MAYSFYPLFPVPQDLAQEVNLDVSHSDGLRMVDDDELDYAPDVMILPSKLKQFYKVGDPKSTAGNKKFILIHMQDRSFHVYNKSFVP